MATPGSHQLSLRTYNKFKKKSSDFLQIEKESCEELGNYVQGNTGAQ